MSGAEECSSDGPLEVILLLQLGVVVDTGLQQLLVAAAGPLRDADEALLLEDENGVAVGAAAVLGQGPVQPVLRLVQLDVEGRDPGGGDVARGDIVS